jgi:hypothetical protein
MQTNAVSTALRDRLGREGTLGLVELLDSEEAAWRDRVLSLAVERYERRLAEEIAALRVALVSEIYGLRSEILKWSFLFWIGQFAAFAGLLAYMLKVAAR